MLILFHHAATNHKLDGNQKISGNVIHVLSFAGMLPVSFWIFSPSTHMCQACQKQKLPIKMTGMRVLAKVLHRNNLKFILILRNTLTFRNGFWEDLHIFFILDLPTAFTSFTWIFYGQRNGLCVSCTLEINQLQIWGVMLKWTILKCIWWFH